MPVAGGQPVGADSQAYPNGVSQLSDGQRVPSQLPSGTESVSTDSLSGDTAQLLQVTRGRC